MDGNENLNVTSLALDVERVPDDPQFGLARDPCPERPEGLKVLHKPPVLLPQSQARRVAVHCMA